MELVHKWHIADEAWVLVETRAVQWPKDRCGSLIVHVCLFMFACSCLCRLPTNALLGDLNYSGGSCHQMPIPVGNNTSGGMC